MYMMEIYNYMNCRFGILTIKCARGERWDFDTAGSYIDRSESYTHLSKDLLLSLK